MHFTEKLKYLDLNVFLGAFVTAPTDRMFKEFSRVFKSLCVADLEFQLWQRPDNDFLVDRAAEVRTLGERRLAEGDFDRGDYRELCELIVHYLGRQVSKCFFSQ